MNQTTRNNFILDLGRLCVASAWIDGELTHDEINALKDLLFSIGEISGEEWAILKMYMEQPVGEAELQEITQRVLSGIQTKEDKELVIKVMHNLFASDGQVTAEEQQFLNELEKEVNAVSTSVFSGLVGALKGAMGRRQSAVESCLRENDLSDYIHNVIYYDVQRKVELENIDLGLAGEKLRKLCLVTGLLAHVAHLDEELEESERKAIVDSLVKGWDVNPKQASLLVEVGCNRTEKGVDYVRLTQNFFACTEHKERKELLKTLFFIANSADKTNNDEIEEIRQLAYSLKLSHAEFIEAKLTISRADRAGL